LSGSKDFAFPCSDTWIERIRRSTSNAKLGSRDSDNKVDIVYKISFGCQSQLTFRFGAVQMTTGLNGTLLKVAAVLWVIWGLVHLLAGVIVLTSDASGGFAAIADAIDAETLAADYAPAVGGILNQHGWNLGWFGVATIVGGVLVWKGNVTAIWVTGMVGGLADLGYLLFVDFPGYVNFFPGTVMTFVSGSAILLSFYVWRTGRADGSAA
jgi:hypothetical protein